MKLFKVHFQPMLTSLPAPRAPTPAPPNSLRTIPRTLQLDGKMHAVVIKIVGTIHVLNIYGSPLFLYTIGATIAY